MYSTVVDGTWALLDIPEAEENVDLLEVFFYYIHEFLCTFPSP